jgi:hypothetical protein
VLFFCPDGAGANDGLTDAEGVFSVFLTYSVADTLQQPFPPRQPDGSFRLECEANLLRAGTVVATWRTFEVPFGPTEAELVQSEVTLRLPGDSPASQAALLHPVTITTGAWSLVPTSDRTTQLSTRPKMPGDASR